MIVWKWLCRSNVERAAGCKVLTKKDTAGQVRHGGFRATSSGTYAVNLFKRDSRQGVRRKGCEFIYHKVHEDHEEGRMSKAFLQPLQRILCALRGLRGSIHSYFLTLRLTPWREMIEEQPDAYDQGGVTTKDTKITKAFVVFLAIAKG